MDRDLVAVEVSGGDQDPAETVGQRLLQRVGADDLAVAEANGEHVVRLDAQRAARVARGEQQQHTIDAVVGEAPARPHLPPPIAPAATAAQE